MKRIIATLFLLPLSLYSSENINECISDIYYGNGIMTYKKDARDALDKTLYNAIKQDIYNGDEELMKQKHNFKLAYNYSAKEVMVKYKRKI